MSTLISPDLATAPARRERTLLLGAFAFLAASSLGLMFAQAARLGEWQASTIRWQHLLLLPVWLFCVRLASWHADKHIPNRDPLMLPLGYLLAGWGNLTVWRLLPDFGFRQTGWLLAGTLVLILIIRQGTNLRWLKEYRYIWLLAGLILTGLTLLFGTHPSGGEPRLWLGLGGLYVQPSEFLRLLLVAYFASFLADRVARDWDQTSLNFWSVLAPLVIVWALSIGLLFVQRDLGTGTLFMGLLAVLLFLSTGRRAFIFLGALFILLAGMAATLTFRVVQARLLAWINPWADPIGYGYQLIQASMSMAAGGILGQGIGLGAPGFVPAAHTDFIFSSIVEEWGLLGGLGLLAALAVLVQRGFRTAQEESQTFRLVLSAGLSAGMAMQVMLIVGGVLRLFPLTGVTVPFVSYGGSSLVTSFAGLAILLKISDRTSALTRYRPRLIKLQTGWLIGVVILALGLGWWTVPRAAELRQRSDNPRRNLTERYSPRGSIYDQADGLLAQSIGQPGELSRYYPTEAAAPVVGFSSDRYGQSGIEAGLDLLLRGERGYSPWSIWWHRLLRGTPPAGHDVRTTIARPIQQSAMTLLEGHVGAIVVLDGTSGNILALASAPTYSVNKLDQEWGQLISDPAAPLLNRATQANYQPGAALAPFVFAWSEDAQVDLPAAQENLYESVLVAGEPLPCARPISTTEVESLQSALRFGCPKPWGLLAAELGQESMAEMVSAFGFNRVLPIPLDQSVIWQGAPPTSAQGLMEFGYGQGELTLSPLQLAQAFSALAAGEGMLPAITLVDASRPPGAQWSAIVPGNAETRAVSAQATLVIRRALAQRGLLEYSAEAVSGLAGHGIGWFLAADPNHPLQPVFVVALESESALTARRLGLGLWRETISLEP